MLRTWRQADSFVLDNAIKSIVLCDRLGRCQWVQWELLQQCGDGQCISSGRTENEERKDQSVAVSGLVEKAIKNRDAMLEMQVLVTLTGDINKEISYNHSISPEIVPVHIRRSFHQA